MAASPALLAAGTTLAEWARERRRVWSDTPLDIPVRATAVIEPEVFPAFEEAIAVEEEPAEVFVPEFVPSEQETVERASVFSIVMAGARKGVRALVALAVAVARASAPAIGRLLTATIDHLDGLRGSALPWLLRGAVLASIGGLLVLAAINRGQLMSRWDHVADVAVAAANRPPMARPQPVVLAAGVGRVTINSSSTTVVTVDGAARGQAPVTLDLPAGAHRLLLRGPDGSVERTVRIQAGEITELNEGIFPGWVALTTPIDLTLSENGQPLKRDERGWAILPPGPHDIHLDNGTLGVHEVRRLVVTPGDTTRISFAPHTSTISLTTNEVADVWIDGTSYGQAPLVDQPIGLGVHDVRLRSAAHERWLRVRATTQPVSVNVDMTAN